MAPDAAARYRYLHFVGSYGLCQSLKCLARTDAAGPKTYTIGEITLQNGHLPSADNLFGRMLNM